MTENEKTELRELLRRLKIWWNAGHGSDDETVTLDLVVDQVSQISEHLE